MMLNSRWIALLAFSIVFGVLGTFAVLTHSALKLLQTTLFPSVTTQWWLVPTTVLCLLGEFRWLEMQTISR